MIDACTREFGQQYHAFSHQGIRFILLNAQLINSGLEDEGLQRKWFENELANPTERKIVALHHPIYIFSPDEANHYDNLNPPGRDWLLDLLAEHDVEAVFAGHVHNFWYDRYRNTDYYISLSTSFVRQDYSELFRVAPGSDSEHGRNDTAKLGYFMATVYQNGHAVQIVRNYGHEMEKKESSFPLRPIGPTPIENSKPSMGFDLRHNWAEVCEIPPTGGLDEFDRKLARNDYPLLALIEMGVKSIRIPIADLRNPVRLERLEKNMPSGISSNAFWIRNSFQ